MAYRKYEIKKGISDVVTDTGEPRSTIYEWTNSETFAKQFGVFERVVEGIGKTLDGEEKSVNSKIVKKIFPATYDIAKCCVKNYSMFLTLAPNDGEKQKHIKGTDIMMYNNVMLEQMDELKDFEKKLLLSTPSVKYAKVMNKYYDKLLDGIAQVSTICTDVDGDYSPESVEKILENLKQLIWYHTILKKLNRASSNTSQFNINTAFKDVMNILENESSFGDINYDGKLQKFKGDEFEREKKKIEAEYYSKISKKIPEDKSIQEFYEKLECDTSCDDDYFKGYRNNFISYSLSEGNSQMREMILKSFLNYSDMYGRLLVPGTLKIIDDNLSTYQILINWLKSNNCSDSELFLKNKSVWLHVQYFGDYFVCGENKYLLKDDEKDFIKNHQIDEAAEMLCMWLNSGSNEDLNKLRNNLKIVETYLRYCAGIIGWLNFENTINVCNDNYDKMCKELKDDNVNKKLRKEVDRFIGQKWRYFIFNK